MADPIVKFPAEQKQGDTPPPRPSARPSLRDKLRRNRRTLLLVVVPILAVVGGLLFYLSGGRYVTTDDAYVGAQKVLVTPDVSGKIVTIAVKEGQIVAPHDVLFAIDPVPYRLAVDQARAKLDEAKTKYDTLRSNIASYTQMMDLANQGVDLKQRDVERKASLVKSASGSQLDLETSTTSLVVARAQLELLQQQLASSKNQLLNDPNLPLEKYPPYAEAAAALADAQRNLDLSVVRAPISGTATQVDNIQLGRSVAAGTPVFSIVDTTKPWVDANPKESDMTYVTDGQPVTMEIDAFPSHEFKGHVGSLSPGTGAQFAILPPQNATGNFVKVVQRVPVRIYFDLSDPYVQKLKAGMSTYVWIDTGHKRTLLGLVGLSAEAGTKTP